MISISGQQTIQTSSWSLTCLDVSQYVHQHQNKLPHGVQSVRSQVQDSVVGVKVKRVPVGVVSKMIIGWNFLRKKQGDRLVLAVSRQKVDDETAEAVHHERARVQFVQVFGNQFLIFCPISITDVDVTSSWEKKRRNNPESQGRFHFPTITANK